VSARTLRGRACAAGSVAALALLTAYAPASASPSAPTPVEAHALDLFRRGTEAYHDGRFQEAVALLLEAYELKKESVLLFNLARAYEGMGDLPHALDAYERYLASAPTISDRKSIEQRIATLQKLLQDRAALESQRDQEKQLAEAERKRAEELRRIAEEQERRPHPSPLPWIIGGAGVAGLGAGVLFGILSRSASNEASADPFRTTAESKYGTALHFATAANVAFVAGGVLTAGGGVWLLAQWRSGANGSGPSPGAALGVGPAGLRVLGTF
jgi:tetratricopeptide (TPR) repeat protein